jgi:predicted RND superfamily exporter protein
MSGAVARSIGAVAQRPWLSLATLVLMTGVATFGYFAPERWLDSLYAKWDAIASFAKPAEAPLPTNAAPPAQPPSPPAAVPAGTNESRFRMTDYDVVAVVESERFFTRDGSERLRKVVSALRELPEVADVVWMDDVPEINVFSLRNSVFPPATATQRQFDRARERALADPLIGGQLLSKDGRSTLLLIDLDWLFVESDEAIASRIRDAAERAAGAASGSDFSFEVGGLVPTYVEIQSSRARNEKLYQFIGYGMAFLMALALFRELRVVVIVAAVPAISVFWTLGLLRLFGLDENPFNVIVLPVLVSLVGFTDGIHVLLETRRHLEQGKSASIAVRDAMYEVGGASFLTWVTTAIGMSSLSWSSNEVVREFGWSGVVGVTAAFVAIVLATPLGCRWLLRGGENRPQKRGLAEYWVEPVGRVVDWTLSHRKAVAFGGILLTIAMFGISSTLRPDQRLTSLLPSDSDATRALHRIEHVTGGMEGSQVRIDWNGAANSDPNEVLGVISAVDGALRREELIGSPMSLKNFVDALPGDPQASDRMSLAELLPSALKRVFYSPEQRAATVNFRVRDVGIAAYVPVFDRIDDELRKIEAAHPGFVVTLEGPAVGRSRGLYRVMLDLFYSLGSAGLEILIVLGIAYRSLRLGLISLLPNVFPLAFTGVCLVLVGFPLELAAVCALTVCLGITVDDTIHFLSRYQVERQELGEEEAIRTAFAKVGAGLISTTFVIVLGVSTIVFSGMREQRIFAAITILTLSSALLADLFFLPPLLATFRKKVRTDA